MKNKWDIIPIQKICSKITDGTHDSPKKADIGKPLVTSKHLKNGRILFEEAYLISEEDFEKINERSKVNKWDLLISMIGTVGELAIVKSEPNYAIKNIGLFCIGNELDAKWFFYYLKSPKGKSDIFSKVVGSTQQYITLKEIRGLNIPYPDIFIRKKIVSILSTLDDKIEINNEINKTLEEMAQTLFKRWFIDFDFPNENGEPYKSSGGKMIDSELGEIPEGWRVGKINEIIEINPKENLKKGINSSYIDMKALSENQSVISGFINRNFTGSGTKFKNKDTLMARITPCLENGKTGFVNCLNNNIVAWGSTEFNVLRSRKNIPKELSYFIAKDEKFRKYAIGNMNGSSGRQRVNGTILGEYRYPIANEFTIYQKFGFIVTEIMNKIENSRKEIQLLIVMRDTLLPKLMNGEVEV